MTVFDARVAEVPGADHVTLEIECGKGTYVRAIVRDIAAALGPAATSAPFAARGSASSPNNLRSHWNCLRI